MKNITLEEILKRKINYINNHPDGELEDVDQGYISAFSEMLSDLNLSEDEFTKKYLEKLKSHRDIIDSVMDGKIEVSNFGAKSGYANAVSEILGLLNTGYMFF